MQFCIIFLKECPLPNYKICSSHTIWIYSWGESFSHKYRTWLLLVSHHIHLLSYSCSTHSAECARRKAYNHSDWSHLKNMVVTLGELLMVPCNHIFLVCPLFLWSGKLFYLPFCPHLQHFPHLPLSWWHCFLFQWENRRKLPQTPTYLHLHPDTMDELCSRLHPSLNQEFCFHQSSLSLFHLEFSFYRGSFSWA